MKKKNKCIIFIALAVLLVIGYFVSSNYLYKKIKNLPPYNYQFVCNDEYITVFDSIENSKYNLFSLLDAKNKIKNISIDDNPFDLNGKSSKVFIFTKDNYFDTLTIEDGYVDCIVDYIYPDGKYYVDYEAKIKIRGNSTSTLDKKPYSIKFSEKIDIADNGKAKKWNFLAEAYDPSLMRNRTFLQLGNDIGLDYTTKTEYTELYIDEMYRGTFLVTEAVEAGENRVEIDMDNGDFMIELEKEREEEGVVYITTEHGIRFSLKDPEEPDEASLSKIEEEVNKFDKVLYSDNYEEVSKYFDIDSFVKYYFVNEFDKTEDFDYSSVNFYKKGDKFYAGPLWDFDQTAGNTRPIDGNGYWSKITYDIYDGESYSGFWCREVNPVFKQLFTYDEFNEEYIKFFNDNKKTLEDLFSENGFIKQQYNEYIDIFNKNFMSQEEGGAGWDASFCELQKSLDTKPLTTQNDQIEFLLDWLNNRYNWLSSNIE